ncbi:MAG: hypothetical protein JW882_08925 [Deltaproteobacteria bacterium]|nr:hypothetical protein [Deltaproteobacteria bacterium]
MGKKKKLNRKKSSPIYSLSSIEEERLNTILEDPVKITPDNINEHIPGPEFALALMERLPLDGPETLGLVFLIGAAFNEKNIQKAVKKIVFKLRQKGVSIPGKDSSAEKPFILKQPSIPEPEAYIGPIDGTGSRGILVILPQIPKGLNIGIGLVSSNEGIIYFIYDHYSKKRSRDIKELFFEQAGKAVETSFSHAATILEKLYKRTDLKSEESSGDYLKLRPWILENIKLLERPAIYDHIGPKESWKETLNVSQIVKLLDHELMAPWILEQEKVQPFLDEISEVEESPIIISGAQKAARTREIREKALKELFPGARRAIIKEDLEEMAYIFFKLGEEEYSRLCLTVASSLDEEGPFLRSNAFLELFLERSLDNYNNIVGKKNIGTGDLITTIPSKIITT